MSVNKKPNKPLILDSALGTELENRGEYLPSFKTSIWSAHCLIHKPEVIKQIHIENIEAGADIITTSNYQATPELLKREPRSPNTAILVSTFSAVLLKTEIEFTVELPTRSILSPAQAVEPAVDI